MQDNFYFLKPLSQTLAQKLGVGWQLGYEGIYEQMPDRTKTPMKLGVAFSQTKDELILGFYREEEEFYWRITMQAQFCCLSFPDDFARAKRNSIDLFTPIQEMSVRQVIQFQQERSFALVFEDNYTLLFKMHGRRANVILFQKERFLIGFHKKFVQDQQIKLSELDRLTPQTFESFEASDYQWKDIFPTFDKSIKQYLEAQDFTSQEPENQWKILENTVKILENPPYYVLPESTPPEFFLFPPEAIGVQTESLAFEDSLEAINGFYYAFARTFHLSQERQEVLKNLHKKLKQSEAYLSKNFERHAILEDGLQNEEAANILMANLHQIPSDITSVELYDFYHDNTRKIKLKKDLSPQKNAENYYRKAKNEKIELQTLQKNLQRKEQEITETKVHIEKIEAFDQLRPLRDYLKKHRLAKEKTEAAEQSLFKKFHYQGWDIWVGKNAKNNDLLTQQYAKKDDLWLHAKDVSGSHVVIKNQAGKKIPNEVIEKAASLAAYYSKRSADTLCPVLFTPRKYVRKTKDLAAGQVIVEKEEVIMVSPERF